MKKEFVQLASCGEAPEPIQKAFNKLCKKFPGAVDLIKTIHPCGYIDYTIKCVNFTETKVSKGKIEIKFNHK